MPVFPGVAKTAPYLAIAESLRQDIAAKSLPPHSRLPSELELVKRYRVARATVRRALAKLQEERLVYSRTGSGSFVAESRLEQDLDHLFSFTELMVCRGIIPGARVLTAQVRSLADPQSAILQALRLKPNSRVIHLRRLRLGNGEPLVVANTWLPHARFPDLLKHDLEKHSVYDIMERTRSKPTDAVQSIEAVTLPAEEAGLLTVCCGSAALLIRRVGYSKGVPVEYAEDYFRGDRTTLRVRLGVFEQHLGRESQ